MCPPDAIHLRHLWGQAKREELTETAELEPQSLYDTVDPILPLGLPYLRTAVSDSWFDWPPLPALFPVRVHGVLTNRDPFLVDIDRNRLRERLVDYFDPRLRHEEIARRYPIVMKTTGQFEARQGRDMLLARGSIHRSGLVRFTYRPFDIRWLYWDPDTRLLERKRAEYVPHVSPENVWMSAAQHLRKGADEPQACFTKHLASHHLIERGANMFPAWLRDDHTHLRSNLSASARRYLERCGMRVEDLFYHVLAVLHDPVYREANAGALRMEWPRIPLPGWPNGNGAYAASTLSQSAATGLELARLLDPDTPVPGVTQGVLRPELSAIAVPATAGGLNMTPADFSLTAGWGHYGTGGAVMPGQGHIKERAYTSAERAGLGDLCSTMGETTYDVYLNDLAYWRNIPATVWTYKLGGYQVLKKWLSYRELGVLERRMLPDEIQYFTDIARRIAAILLVCRSRSGVRPESRAASRPDFIARVDDSPAIRTVSRATQL